MIYSKLKSLYGLFCRLTVKLIKIDEGVSISIPRKYLINSFAYYRYTTIKIKEPDTFFWISTIKDAGVRWTGFVDVGCNVGVFSVLAVKKMPWIDVFAFDPLLENCATTRKFLKTNSGGGVGVVQQVFLSKSPGVQKIFDSDLSAGFTIETSKLREKNKGDLADNMFSLPIRSFHVLTDNNDLYPANIVKIDVDGAEVEVLKGFSCEQFCNVGALIVEADVLDVGSLIELYEVMGGNNFSPSLANLNIFKCYIKCVQAGCIRNDLLDFVENIASTSHVSDKVNQFLIESQYHHIKSERCGVISDESATSQRLAVNLYFYNKKIVELFSVD